MRLRFALVSLLAGVCALVALDRSPHSSAVDPDRVAGTFPSDWFAMQRAFPGETIDQDAYRAAMDQAVFERTQQELSTSSGLMWTQAGPYNIGGRVTALAVTPGGTTVYLGSANGGVWKSVNAGVNWAPIFDHQGSSVFSIGALALQPGDPNVLYVGTGEANAANDSYDGYGLYRSTNGGGNWSYLGLGATRRIARVVVDPSNTNRIFVAAMGTQYSTNPDRGLYRSEDGGVNWTKVLFVSDSTGANDVVINPVHPETLFCATWERVRHNTYRRAFGPECRIWRSADHGTTWTVLSNGLPPPSDGVGRIALAIAPSRPSTIYAQYTTGSPSYAGLGLFRSLDGGQTWVQRDADPTGDYTNNFGGFSWYFGDMAVDPTDPEKIYCLGQFLARSADGGVNFDVIGGSGGVAHPDFHAIWIDPANTNRIFHGSDGGFYWTTNGGAGWSKSVDLPITQFYAGAIDPSNSNRLLGGTQDNNSIQTTTGIPTAWTPMVGGDGFQCMVDPTNSNIVFAEFQYCSMQGSQVGPLRSTNGGGSFAYPTGASASDRWNWNSPMVMDPTNHNVILCASHRVYRSTTNGLTYTAVSGDLTSHLPSLLLYGTITTLAISPANSAIYYAGTDDGRVWRSLNSSGSWTEISAGLPVRWVTRVTADPVSPGTVYVTLSGFSSDESQAHVYRSTNNGDTWTSISGNLPNAPANDILPDPSDPNTLYLATDLGVYITRNLGGTWYPFGTGMPLQAVFDLTLHQGSRKLVAATHGRSQWSIDLSALPVAVGPAASPVRLALSAPAPNPSRAIARLDFEMATAGDADVTVFDSSGRRVRNLVSGAQNAGRITLAWDGLDARRQRVGAGVYFVRAQVAGASVTRRLVRVE